MVVIGRQIVDSGIQCVVDCSSIVDYNLVVFCVWCSVVYFDFQGICESLIVEVGYCVGGSVGFNYVF